LLARVPKRGVTVHTLGPAAVRVHQPATGNGPRPALLWVHGGGYVIGTAAQDDAICGHIAQSLGIVVAAVDYRLAPEHPFPVPRDWSASWRVQLKENAIERDAHEAIRDRGDENRGDDMGIGR